MEKNVIVSLIGKQKNDEQSIIELVTEGKYYTKNDNYYLTYQETAITGLEGTTTTLKLENDKLTLTRTGKSNAVMIFEKGQKHVTCYETAFGALVVGVASDNVNVKIDEEGGEVFASYSIEINNSFTSLNDFHISIKEC